MNQIELTQLMNKYFEGETSIDEERLLKHELSQTTVQSPLIDEARAVLGYSISSKDQFAEHQSKQKHSTSIFLKVASIALVISLSTALFFTLTNKNESECYAYINGVKVTDSETVSLMMMQNMSDIAEIATEAYDETQADIYQITEAINSIITQ